MSEWRDYRAITTDLQLRRSRTHLTSLGRVEEAIERMVRTERVQRVALTGDIIDARRRGTGTSIVLARFTCRPELPIYRLRQG